MGEILVGASLLIFMVMILRHLSRGRISMRFRYALWLIVVLRLVIPVSFGSSPFSILNLTSEWTDGAADIAKRLWPGGIDDSLTDGTAEGIAGNANAAVEGVASKGVKGTGNTESSNMADTGGITDKTSGGDMQNRIPGQAGDSLTTGDRGAAEGIHSIFILELMRDKRIRYAAMAVWAAGIAAVGGYMLVSQRRFMRYLHSRRSEVPAGELPGCWNRRLEEKNMHVYLVKGLPGPCLAGRDIYIAPELLEEKRSLQHVLAHEYTHAVQGDTWWAFVRCLLCVVYWFYPLVWLAAYEAKKDSELSCDEYAVRVLGEEERFAYGRTLLVLLSGRDQSINCAGAVLIMGGRENSIKERITMIAGKNKNSRVTAVIVAAAAACICGCAFTGAAAPDKEILLTNQAGPTDNDRETIEDGEQTQAKRENAESGADEQTESADELRTGGLRKEEEARDAEDEKSFGADYAVFREVLDSADDSGLASAETVDVAEYYNYLYENAELPVTDGTWYRLLQEDETGIEFYGLYTQDYGFRGLKIRIGDDVNTFDEPWLPTYFGIDTVILEVSETDGMPRSFAFKICIVNNGISERWRFYVADRYDTGTIELSCFDSYDYREQIEKQKITLSLDREAQKVNLVHDGDVVIGSVDISDYADEKITEAVWDDEAACFLLEEDGGITFLTGIGLRADEGNKTFYKGLSLIGFPVEIGSFGNREFTLGASYVDKDHSSARLN